MRLWRWGRGGRDFEREMNEELRFHVERQAAENVAAGMTADEARRQAVLQFGGVEGVKETCRSEQRGHWFETVLQDVRYGVRMLRKSPGFTVVAVLTLALGIGANAAIFSVVDAVLFRSLPYPDAGRLVVLNEWLPRSGELNVALPDFLDWQAQSRVFDGMAAYSSDSATLTGAGEPVVLPAAFVSWSFFPLLGAKPLLGRTFTEAEDKAGSPWVGAVISYSLWRNRLRSDPKIIGKTITLDGEPGEIIGVLRPGFHFPGLKAEVYDQMGPLARVPGYANRSNHPGIQVLARLKSGVSLAAARSDMNTIMGRLGAQYPKSDQNERANIVPLYFKFLGTIQRVLLILFGAAGLVLLLACVNVANLFLARTTVRRKELALRAAMGASRARLIRQLLTESVLLSLFGGLAGLLLAFWGMKPLLHLAPVSIPNIAGVQLNSAVLLFAFGAAALTGIVFGVAPSLGSTRLDLNRCLKGNASAAAGLGRQRLRSILLVAEIAAAMVLATGAGLLIRSLSATLAVNPGFEPDHLLALDVAISGSDIPNFYNETVRRIRALPGVQSAAAVMQPPMAGERWTSPYTAAAWPAPAVNQQPWTALNSAMTGYFQTIRARLLDGRFFSESDGAGSRPVAIVNETMARSLNPDGKVTGKLVHVEYAPHPLLEIVGVVRDLKQDSLEEPDMPEVYVPFAQMPIGFMTVVVRTSVAPSSLTHAVTGAIHSLNKDLPVTHVAPMTEYIADSVEMRRFLTFLVGLFGLLALLLAAVGTYGVTAYSVSQRTHEVGVRMALGARPADVLRMVIGGGASFALAGIATGTIGALALTRLVRSELFEVSPTDPVTFAGVAALLLIVALGACYIPARRAMRVDPMVALRQE